MPVKVIRDHDGDHPPTVSIVSLVIALNLVPRIFWPYARLGRLRASPTKHNHVARLKTLVESFPYCLRQGLGHVLRCRYRSRE